MTPAKVARLSQYRLEEKIGAGGMGEVRSWVSGLGASERAHPGAGDGRL